ncbi:S1 family peptidase [Actinacidiphila oryziradicis]|uniref:Trypsin-like peptidase domain-containing protein n=1 Tax=Actinacidiphila oryziradicis TaxID=2571141 RepID=A0A4U0SNA3_9ACTN|nr:serine protease [Actinacidiphila oryziradicis]TKA11312.1 trypsin-like peptidase domain-containing protein [Actinacidiphila oryziradicis]
MEADGGIGVETSLDTPHWAARIRRDNGKIAGTGILLSPDRVLTCAHVVAKGERVTAEFVGAPGHEVPSVPAWVLDDAYRPETLDADGDPSGDVALLRLERPRPAAEAVSLYRLSAPNREVRMYGFPKGYNGGIWLRATIIGGCGRDGQVQLGPQTPGELARPGCSGAGVVDVRTGQVIGMVLSAQESDGSGFSFMSPAETIVQHLPQVAEWTRGRTAVDEKLRSRDSGGDEALLDEPFAQRLARWFRGDGRQVKISLVPADDWARAATLRRAITLADRELRTRASTGRASLDPPETVPSAGGHDLAVDAAGLTAARIAERIAERMGLWQHPGDPVIERIRSAPVTLTLVVAGVDEAADPPALLDLLVMLMAQGSRLLLVFRTPDTHYRRAQSELVIGPTQGRYERLVGQLDEITGPLAVALHERMAAVRADTGPAVDALVRAHAVREDLAGTRGVVAGLGQSPELAAYERVAGRARARLDKVIARLDALLRRRDELRGRLTAYHALYQGATDREDLEAETHYRDAYELLHTKPCDLEAAEAAVHRYIHFVERWGRKRPGQGGASPL